MSVRACKFSFILEHESNDYWLFQWIKRHRVWTSCARIIESHFKGHQLDCEILFVFLPEHSWEINPKQRRRKQRHGQNCLVGSQRHLRHRYSRKVSYFFVIYIYIADCTLRYSMTIFYYLNLWHSRHMQSK